MSLSRSLSFPSLSSSKEDTPVKTTDVAKIINSAIDIDKEDSSP